MASKPASETKPAAKKPAAKEKPAARENPPGVGIKDLASDLGTDNFKAVRARIRRFKGGAQVGQGGRYRWDSKSDPEYKELVKGLKAGVKSDENDES